jgi:ATP-dependent Clp protease ATP-binding subunit ClpA
MTQQRRSKRAIRSRMAQTGEKYTEARRALLSSGGDSDRRAGEPEIAFAWPADPLGWFTHQAHNLILLAEDEARMLSHPRVEPEHLLLATARRGSVERLLDDGAGRAIHDAIERINGFGAKLELRPRRSPASEQVLDRAIIVAADRGVLGPSAEHLLLALAEHELPARILAELRISDVEALVDAKYPITRPPIDPALLQRRAAQLATRGSTPPTPGPNPPIFERFTSHARDAINAGIEAARKLDDPHVAPMHLLLGALDANGIVATVRTRLGWEIPPTSAVRRRYSRATDIFSDDARRIVAEDVLIIAERLDHRPLTTGHLLIALLESPDDRTTEMINWLPDPSTITAAIVNLLADRSET